jgi:hypothetical protein
MEDNEGLALAIVLPMQSFVIYGDVNIEEGLDKNVRLGLNELTRIYFIFYNVHYYYFCKCIIFVYPSFLWITLNNLF